MKIFLITILIFLSINQVSAQTGTVVVEISGVASNKGLVQIALHNNGNNFPKSKKPYKTASPRAYEEGLTYTFRDVVPGEYAVTVYHDENSNNKLDRYFFGPPKENYGFSRNIYHTFSPPTFDEVKFKLNEDKIMILKIRLK